MSKRFLHLSAFILILRLVWPIAALGGIENTVHNLTATGPGQYKAQEVGGLCIFCHVTHNASATRALWNRDLPAVTYKLYESSTAQALFNQPTGSTRLCLSCHDGTVALGDIRVKPEGVLYISLGPLQGSANLGTDLSDDHPVSFVYDPGLVLKDPQLEQPALLPKELRLDDTAQMQCSTCHDPHTEKLPKFLRVDKRYSALCTKCHKKPYWDTSSHSLSGATWNGSGSNPWPGGYSTVAENACQNCHRPHSAGHPERLLKFSMEEDNCLICHSGTVASKDLSREFQKPSVHPIGNFQDIHDPMEDPFIMLRHVECMDCHNPHVVAAGQAAAPWVSPRNRGVSGISGSGTIVKEAQYLYEICFKCHGITEAANPIFIRQDNETNVRLELSPSNPSYHPVMNIGKNPDIPGLEPGYTATSIIYCTDCHNNNDYQTGPRGPHGSINTPILERRYDATGRPAESYATYALCYKCHTRSVLYQSNPRSYHYIHVFEEEMPCANCHDAHGSRLYPSLVNFKLREKTGEVVVSTSKSGRLEYIRYQRDRLRCYLTCHGANHDPFDYPPT